MHQEAEMITARLMGGLGNQLFQYATAYSIAKQKNTKLYLDDRAYHTNNQHGGYRLDKLRIPHLSLAADKLKKPEWKIKVINKQTKFGFIDSKIIHESNFKSVAAVPEDALLLGYWQNSKYFSAYLADLRRFFVPVSPSPKAVADSLIMQESNSVSIHIRRGDYISNPEALRNHGVCSIEYYKQAIGFILETVENPAFFIFSDDISWVEENLSTLFIKNTCVYMKGNTQEEDLWLMSNARHHIIANSSFSWWGAYLASDDAQIVVSPIPWFDIPQRHTSDPSESKWKRFPK